MAVDKPAGFHVHPPEDSSHRISKNTNCLYLLGKQLGLYLHPVHRLDRATSGVVLFALSSEMASRVAEQFRDQRVGKVYFAVTRGWVPERGRIDRPLKSEHDPEVLREAETHYERLAQVEFPVAVGRYPTARYSLVRVEPKTGRMHQIRRHFASISHPLLGDTLYGNGAHNRFLREKLGGRQALLLHGHELTVEHPVTGARLRITAKWTQPWHKVFEWFELCPF